MRGWGAPPGHGATSKWHGQGDAWQCCARCVPSAVAQPVAVSVAQPGLTPRTTMGLLLQEMVLLEIDVMNQLNHRNLIQLYDAIETPREIILFMEL